jgi:hypothetical protein
MSSRTKHRSSRYLAMPIEAFREGEEFDLARLPVHIRKRPWRRASRLFFVLSGFFAVLVVVIHLENTFGPQTGEQDLSRFPVFLWSLVGLLLVAGAMTWKRADEIEFRSGGVRIWRRGLLGTDMREAPISDYRGIRATDRYVEDSEVTSGTTYWDVELVHDDPALAVSLFARSRDEPSDDASAPPPGDRTDWTDHMNLRAQQWSRELDLPLLSVDESGD